MVVLPWKSGHGTACEQVTVDKLSALWYMMYSNPRLDATVTDVKIVPVKRVNFFQCTASCMERTKDGDSAACHNNSGSDGAGCDKRVR